MIMLAIFVRFTAGLAVTTSAFSCNGNYFSFFNRHGDTLGYARLDPSVYPGTTSPHLHSFDGSSGLSASATFKNLIDSKCTTARIKRDKSLYWRPTLYWSGNNTGFYRVPEQQSKIYYKFGDGDQWANVTGFPKDFSMIAGFPNKRAAGDNPAGVRWACHRPEGRDDTIFSEGFPTGFQSCKYGFASEVTFPSCWNGKNIDANNPQAHMAYPGTVGVGIENCPATHRVARFPTVFIEFWYDISSFDEQYNANSSPWVLSNGDPTGFGFHADFMNGWETGVLEKAIQEKGGCYCGCGCGQTDMEQCFGSANVNRDSDPAFQQCNAMAADTAEAAKHVDTLPGCNTLQKGPANAIPEPGPDCVAAGATILSRARPLASPPRELHRAYSQAVSPSIIRALTVEAKAPWTGSAHLNANDCCRLVHVLVSFVTSYHFLPACSL